MATESDPVSTTMITTTTATQTGPRTFKQKVLVWLWNLVNAVMGGVATAGSTLFAGFVVGAATFTPRQLGCVLAAGGAIAAFNYVRTNRLPAMFEGEG